MEGHANHLNRFSGLIPTVGSRDHSEHVRREAAQIEKEPNADGTVVGGGKQKVFLGTTVRVVDNGVANA